MPFKCVIPNSRFFMVIFYMAIVVIFMYIALTMYNLVWLVDKRVSRLQRILFGMYRR